MKPINFHLFADASNLACSAVTIAVAEQTSGTVKGLLTSKSRISKRTSISRLETRRNSHGSKYEQCPTPPINQDHSDMVRQHGSTLQGVCFK